MSEYSDLVISEMPTRARGKYRLIFRLALENGNLGHHLFDFGYDYEVDRSLLLFVELAGTSCNVVVRMSTEEGDRKSIEMFELFRSNKAAMSKRNGPLGSE